MENLTRREIERAFLSLIEEKGLEKVTVNDIAAKSGVNRNTFYYHYRDIPSLLEAVFQERAEGLFGRVAEGLPLSDALESFYASLEENRLLVAGVFSSPRRDRYMGYLGNFCGKVAAWLVGIIGGEQRLSPVQREAVVEILKCEFIGQVMQWAASGFAFSMEEYGLKICREIKSFI